MKITIGLVVLAIFGFAIFWLTPITQGQKPQLDDATPVKKGVSTEQERAFSEEFAKLYPDRQKVKLSELKSDGKEFGIGLAGPGDSRVDIPAARESMVDEIFRDLACKSDLAIIGRATSKASHLAADETFIFTQYDIKVEDIVFTNREGLVNIGDLTTVAWPGGRVKLDGRTIGAIDFSYAQLKPNSKYLLFLRYVPDAKGYIPVGPESDYEIDSDALKRNSPGRFGNKDDKLERSDFLSRNQRTRANQCGRNE